MIDLEAKHLAIVKKILKKHVPNCETRVFGSRITGKARKYSDLDLAVKANSPLTLMQLGDLKDAFSESDLPILVDVLDWSRVSPEFQKIIEENFEVLPY